MKWLVDFATTNIPPHNSGSNITVTRLYTFFCVVGNTTVDDGLLPAPILSKGKIFSLSKSFEKGKRKQEKIM